MVTAIASRFTLVSSFVLSCSPLPSCQTRRELRASLESELASFDTAVRDNGLGNIAWNHQQFEVTLRV